MTTILILALLAVLSPLAMYFVLEQAARFLPHARKRGAYPAPVQTGSSSVMTFLLQAETGIIIGSFGRKTDSKEVEIYDAALGYTTGDIYHDFKAGYDVKGRVTNASAGVCAASPGVAVTLANTTSGAGVTTGLIFTQSTSLDHTAENPREFSITARQRPGITS